MLIFDRKSLSPVTTGMDFQDTVLTGACRSRKTNVTWYYSCLWILKAKLQSGEWGCRWPGAGQVDRCRNVRGWKVPINKKGFGDLQHVRVSVVLTDTSFKLAKGRIEVSSTQRSSPSNRCINDIIWWSYDLSIYWNTTLYPINNCKYCM